MRDLTLRLEALAVFRGLLEDPVLSALRAYWAAGPLRERVAAYARLAARIYETPDANLSRHIRRLTEGDENVYIRMVGRGQTPPPALARCVDEELRTLQAVAELTPEDLLAGLDAPYLPAFDTAPADLAATYRRRVAEIGKYGYGIYARHHMFYLDDRGEIVPVRHPDGIRLSELVDYRREQAAILDNTRALLAGRPAANILLTGDAGTGKSSTIKAVVNELRGEGLRIIELRKEQLRAIPALLDRLSDNPLKFILFIDDLSFRGDDDNYSALKAVLEGSVSAKSRNVAIYATSNRRHLVRESFSDRAGDDVHRGDTMQEQLSLSERFGLHLTFQKPDKATYLHIVRHLAQEAGVAQTPELELLAERFALARGARSARAARQFVDSLLSAAPGG